MSNFIRLLVHAGIEEGHSTSKKRGILLSNQINLILLTLGLLLSVVYWITYPPNVVRYLIPSIGVIGLTFIGLNGLRLTIISRIGTSLFLPLATMALSIYSKGLYYDQQLDLDYFSFRFIILGSSILPAILFSTREKTLLISCLLFNFVVLMLHDTWHELFQVGYAGNGMAKTTYDFANVVVAITYFILLGSLLFLKINLERADRKNTRLLEEVEQRNQDLQSKNDEIEAQHQEMWAQSEKINQNQTELLNAYALIEKQKELLSHQNRNLESELLIKNKDLSETNTELIKYNHELRQFSYTISHNLRGPVASLLGLVSLLDRSTLTEENLKITDYISTSTERLDAIIQDLNKIIDIRNDIFQIRQKVTLAEEMEQIKKVLHLDTEATFISLAIHLSACEQIYSVRPMVHSILYNLISNAIKYRAPERLCEIRVRTEQTKTHYILQVEDNGLGIDMASHQENLFKLYKRFHHHTEGKGIGLYLVKLQCEALGGHIEVESELNKYTRFTVHLRKPENIERQILFDKPYARIFFDASVNATGIIWQGPLTSEQYRTVFIKSLEFVKAYNTPNYIADISQQGSITAEDQQWMFTSIIPDAAQFGLRRIASIKPDAHTPTIKNYLNGINQSLATYGVHYEMFETMDEATYWMRAENEQELLVKR